MFGSFKRFLFMLMMSEFLFIANTSQETEDSSSMVGLLTSGSAPEKWEPVRHRTSLGVIEGRKEESVGSQVIVPHYYAFRGVPFAHPPVGVLRFSDTVDDTDTWPDNHLDATHYGSVCLQFNGENQEVVGDEDCLFLNIFTPALPGTESEVSGGLPVLVFIHGGGFIRGSSSIHAGARLAGQNIVLVTINYRLGALGFLSTEDEVIPGNFAGLDQVSALRWVQRNIAEFGGDPKKVTVGGFSAGSASSHLHLLSPLSKGLFRSVILTSGSGYCPWAVQRVPFQTVELYAKILKCPSKSSVELKACLDSKTPEDLLRAQAATLRYEYWPVSYTFTIDAGFRKEPFLPAPIMELTPAGPLPVLIGETPSEGFVFALTNILLSGYPTDPEGAYNQVVRDVVSSLWFHPDKAEMVAEAAETFYYSEKAKESMNVLCEEMSEAMTDYNFHSCISHAAARMAKDGSPVYTYLYTHRDPESPVWSPPIYKKARSVGINTSLLDEAVSHGDNLEFIFRKSNFLTERDEAVSQFLASNWATFVTNGSPSVAENEWPALNPRGPVLFYNVSTNSHMQKTPFKAKEANFWLQTIPFMEKKSATETQGRQDLMPLIFGAVMTFIVFSLTNRINQ